VCVGVGVWVLGQLCNSLKTCFGVVCEGNWLAFEHDGLEPWV
jgi:hypothetical protein